MSPAKTLILIVNIGSQRDIARIPTLNICQEIVEKVVNIAHYKELVYHVDQMMIVILDFVMMQLRFAMRQTNVKLFIICLPVNLRQIKS